jgi:hypothetical protein
LSERNKAGAGHRADGHDDAPLGELRTLGAGRAAALLQVVAQELVEQVDEIAATMVRAYKVEIPAYAALTQDEALEDDVHAVSSALVRCWLTIMSTGEEATAELLRPMTEGARRRAAQGVDLQSHLRAYRVGIRVMWSEITGSPVWRGPALQGAMAQVATWALDFADKLSTVVAGAYMDEAEHLAREREHRRSALLNVILSGPVAEPIDHPQELDQLHGVVVVRVAPDLTLLELEQTGQLLEERVGALLWTVRHRSVVAAVPLTPAEGRDRLVRRLGRLVHEGQIVAIALGGRAEGVAETRQSYAEAIAALRVGPLLATTTSSVHDFQELAPLLALLENADRARRFAASVLEPFGDLTRTSWLLPTLEAYLVHQGRMKQAAAALGVHVNTIKYRLKELRPLVDRTFTDGNHVATLLLAIRIHSLLEAEAGMRTAAARGAAAQRGGQTAEDEHP